MNLTTRSIFALTMLAAGSGAVFAQQTLTFSNTDTDPSPQITQPLAVNLEAGSAVSIAPNGNISARCMLGPAPSTICAGINAGGGGTAPTVTLAPSGLPTSAPPYPAGTSFTITPSVSGAEVCVRSVTINAAPAQSTGWPATVPAPFGAQVVNLPTASATYLFSMRCYGAGGATSATSYSVQTSNAIQPGSCGSFVSPLPPGWNRSGIQAFGQVPSTIMANSFWQPFPSSGFPGALITGRSEYHSVGFTTPADGGAWAAAAPLKTFSWIEASDGGEALLGRVYVSLSSCPGDFRIPPLGQIAPVNDTTFARGCRNIRPLFGSLNHIYADVGYVIAGPNQPSDDTTCRLVPGTSYFMNFIRANATDGSIGLPADEAECQNGNANFCGIWMSVL